MSSPGLRVQKYLAQLGLGSRREIEEWIRQGRIKINEQLAKLGDRVTPGSKIKIDNKLLTVSATEEKTRIILYHKPVGEVCTRRDPENRKTVFESLPPLKKGRWINIGRLDINTSGLLLFTNDGDLANRYMHPSQQIEREYAVRIFGEVNEAIFERFLKGIKLEDGLARVKSIVDAGGSGKNHWYHVVVTEGRNRLVRRLFESQNLTVSRLIRLRFGNITLKRSLRPGRWMDLKENME